MNKALLHKEVQEFITENFSTEVSRIIFQGSPFRDVSVQELATQLTGKKKAKNKLPTWFSTEGIIYPPGLNLEQTSSEITASYKSGLFSGDSMVDLTGGFGVDAYFFSRQFKKVVHCEINSSLSELVTHNNHLLGVSNLTYVAGDGIEFLKNTSENFSWIYLDPSRRTDSGGRSYHLSDCLPNVPEHLDLLYKKSPNILMKSSPFLDLQAGITALKGVKEIHIVAVKNEVKELLWILNMDFSEAIKIKSINIKKNEEQVFESFLGRAPEINFSAPLSYLYEPNAAIMKSGLFEDLGEQYQLPKLHSNTHLFTSDTLVDFPGRRFRILEILPYNRKKIKQKIIFEKSHIATRNFPESAVSLRKQLKLKDGGNHYLFFTTAGQDKKMLLICEKID